MEYIISSGEVSSGIILNSHDSMTVLDSGTANNTTVNMGGDLRVSSGGVANSTTVNSSGYLHISSGGTVNVATVYFGGTVSVFSGATATRIREIGGWVSVQSGANVTFESSILSGLYLSNHCATVHSGTTANSTMIDFGGALGVYSGGTANVVSVGAYGNMGLVSGGTANSVSVDSQGKFIVDYGGTANNTLVSGGQVYNTIANDLGSFFVYGTANDTEVSSGGLMTVFSGGTANNTTVHDVGRFFVSSGGVANNATVNGGYFIVCSGGKATGRMIVSSGATAYVSSGGILDFDITGMGYNAPARINDLSLISGWTNAVFTLTFSDTQANGRFALANGVYEFNKTITVRSASGATLGALTVGSALNIRGTDCILTLNNGELALTYGIPPDCVAPTVFNVMADIVDPTNRDVTVTAMFSDDEALAQSLYRIGSGGVWQSYVNGVTVSENTTVYFKAVDVAGNESEIATYNVVNIDKVAPTVSDIQANVLYPTLNTVTVTAAFADNVALSEKLYRIGPGGVWQSYVNGVTVSENTTVYFKAVDTAGNESEVASYTVANIKVISGAVVSSGYSRIVSSGFIYVDPIISSGGRMIVSSGGSVRRTTLTPGAHMAVSSGGRASEIMENGGSINVEDNASATFVPNTISGLVLSVYTGRASVHSGTTATSATIRAGGGLGVYSGGTANNTMIYSGGTLYLYGGTVNSTTQYYGGFMVFSASKVYDTVLNSGWIYLYNGSLNRTNVNGGYFSAYKGTTLSDTTISGGYGYCSGTMAGITTICSGGSLYIASNGILAGQVNISSGGSIILSSGASVYLNLSGLTPGATARITHLSQISGLERASFTISLSDLQTDGTYVIAEGASGFNRTISVWTPYGNCSVSAGYTAFLIDSYYTLSLSGDTLSLTCSKGTIVRSGRRVVSSGWTSDGISVLSAGGYYVFSDGTANDTEVNSGGYMYVLSDGTANDTEVDSGGSMYVSSGGTANFTTVSSGGVLSVISGGTANFTTVSLGGVMIVYTGGVCRLNGQSRIKNYAKVSAFSGAVFDFDISETDSVTTACIENLSRITGVLYANYVITVSNSQSDGTYTLADGATGFNKTISVVNTSGEELGSLSIGETTTIGGTDYTLNLNNGTLSVTLSGSTPPEPEPELPANTHFFPGCFAGGTQAMLAKRTDRIVTVYQNGEPWGLGVTLDPGWEVVGVGDFNGDGRDDFLRVNTEGYVAGEMSNGNGTFSPQVLNFLNDGWSILGVGDFNGNGTDDVLIANPTGASDTVGLLGYWESGVTWTLINGYSPEWECVATGDFNGDGKCDMLWRNQFEGDGGLTYNAYCTWIVEDPVDWRMVSVANPAEWNFLCSGDFNGDKMNDIAMINGDGVVGIWGVNDGYLSSWSILSAVTSEWQLAGVADYNGDGTDDIAWANTDTGLVGYWQIENKELASWQNIVTLG